MLRLGDKTSIVLEGETIRAKIVGIDKYVLENFDGKDYQWFSYTLVSISAAAKRFKRFWVTDWKQSGWILWMGSKKRNFTRKILAERSGISKIEFCGEQGISTPVAAVVVYRLKKGEYYAMERFAGSKVMYFTGKNISKPKKL